MKSAQDDPLASLERFVTENEDLLELEQRIGRFNIFDALRLANVEIRHSNFLAWVLDPAESHGQGGLFLKAVLMDLLRQAPRERRPLSPVELDGVELNGVEVRREWRNIDVLICSESPAFVIAIENKIGAGEHGNQLTRYKQAVRAEFNKRPHVFVFLTTDGDDPTDSEWIPYRYADLHRVFSRVLATSSGSIGADVATFIDHYLRLIGSRFMDDQKITELCERIYRNHRHALQIIFERVGSPAAGLLAAVEEEIRKHAAGWEIVRRTGQDVYFMPANWASILPAIGSRATFDPRHWLVLRIGIRGGKASFGAVVWPCKDTDMRRKVIERLTADPKEFKFRIYNSKSGKTSDSWSAISNETIATWDENREPDEQAVLKAVSSKLDEISQRLSSLPDAVLGITGDGALS